MMTPLGPAREILAWAQEAVVGADLHRHRQGLAPILHHLPDPPLAGLGDDDARGRMTGHRPLQLAGEAAGVAGLGQADVVDRDALGFQFGREMAHRGEQERDLLLVVAHIGRLVPHLDQQDDIALGSRSVRLETRRFS